MKDKCENMENTSHYHQHELFYPHFNEIQIRMYWQGTATCMKVVFHWWQVELRLWNFKVK